jgi:hypothetical protein
VYNQSTFLGDTPLKNMTPMAMLKPELAQFKALAFISYLELNGKEERRTYANDQVYIAASVTFDFMAIFNIRGAIHHNEKGHQRFDRSFSFCFNFKNGEPTIRASIKPSKDLSAEYSREFSVAEIKPKMNALLALGITDKEDFLKEFVQEFDIVISSALTLSALNAIKAERIKEVEDVMARFKAANQAVDAARELLWATEIANRGDSKLPKQRAQMSEAMAQAKALLQERTFLLNGNTKNIPAYARDLFYKELKQKNIIS